MRFIPALALALCAFTAGADEVAVPASARDTYRLQPGDVLSVSVWKEQDLQQDVLVRPDGALTFPLAGELDVNGRTVEDMRRMLVERLSKFVPDPVVTVTIKAIG